MGPFAQSTEQGLLIIWLGTASSSHPPQSPMSSSFLSRLCFHVTCQICSRPGSGTSGQWVAAGLPCTHGSYYSARTTGKKAPSYKPLSLSQLNLPLPAGPLKCTSAHLSECCLLIAAMSISLRPRHLQTFHLTLLSISQSTILSQNSWLFLQVPSHP